MTGTPPPRALEGIRVLDFTRVLAGPFCTMLLADLGAEVIKVERPGLGDDTRHWGPPWAGSGQQRQSAYFLSVNRNKRSLTLDLKQAEGQAIARDLALKSDVLIENFKVGQMAGYGLDFPRLQALHPQLVYCSITGYGQDGPYAAQPGYDYLVQGQSGLMSITGPAEGDPYKVGVAISDVITGLMAANAIQAALLHRARGGAGQYIDIALLDSQVAALVNVLSNYLVSGQPPARYGNAHPNIVPYQAFEAADGPFILAVGNDRQFAACCNVIGQPALAQDARFASNPSRVEHRAALIPILQAAFRQQPRQVWQAALLAAGVPAGPIHDIPGMVADPQVQARGLVQQLRLADGSPVALLGSVLRLSATPPQIQLPPPQLGEHTDAILRELLGMDAAALASYHAKGLG